MDAKYETLDGIQQRRHDFENWSLLLMEEETKCRRQTLAQPSMQ